MKKPVALLTSALLATSVVLGATSCASKNVEKLLPDGSMYSRNTKTLTALANIEEGLGSVNTQGLMLVTTVNKDAEGAIVSRTYKLFDVSANAWVSGAEITVPADQSPAADALTYSVISAPTERNGIYFTTKTTYTKTADDTPTTSVGEVDKVEYTLYGKNGKVAENVEGSFNSNTFEAKDGTRYYLDVKGNVAKESDPLARILTWYDLEDVDFVGDYLVEEVTDAVYTVYDKSGNYVRTVNGTYELAISLNRYDDPTIWSVGNYMFVQYLTMLPENEKKYDVIIADDDDGAQKFDLVTKRYDLEKGKVKDIDMDYVVLADSADFPAMSMNDETTILNVYEIKDEQLIDSHILQSFDKNGDVAVDLQKLVPGARKLAGMGEDYIVLVSADMEYVVQDKKVVGEFVGDAVSYSGNVAYTTSSDTVRFYNLDGTLNKAYTDVLDVEFSYNTALLKLESSVVKYDLRTKTETVVCTYDAENGDVYVEDWYVSTINYGADKEAYTDDDTYSVYFLVDGMSNLVNLSGEEAMKYEFDQSEDYSVINVDTYTFGAIYYVGYTTGEGADETTTRTFYASETSINMALAMAW